jgi:hypothetical protein
MLPFFGLMLTSEFTLPHEPTDASGVAAIAILPADGPNFFGSERRTEPKDPVQKLKLLIIKSIC